MLHLGGTVNVSSCTETKLKLIKPINTDGFANSWKVRKFLVHICTANMHSMSYDVSYDVSTA